MILSGCDFKDIPNFFTQTIPQEFQKIVDGMMGKKSEEPKKEEKEEQPEGQEEQQPETQKQLVSISVSGEFKTQYEPGEEFDPTGIVVTAVYDDESSEDVTSQTTFSGFSSESEGPCTVTASFGGQSASIELTIKATFYEFKQAKAMFAADEEVGEVDVPNYAGEGLAVTIDDSDLAEKNDILYYVKNTTHADMEAYAAALTAAGWTLEQDEYNDYHGTYKETRASVYVADYLDYSSASIWVEFFIAQKPVNSITFEPIISAAALQNITLVIPAYEGQNLTFEISETGLQYLISNSSHEDMDAWAASMTTAGWNLETDSYGDYSGTFGETSVGVSIQDWIGSYYDGILITFTGVTIPAEYPAQKINDDLAAAGVTDSLPPYSGVSGYYSYYSKDGERQIMFSVATGDTEASAIARYQSDLTGAGYSDVGADTYGDHHFESPNHQLNVVAWAGSDIGYDGYVFVDIVVL